MTNPRAWLISLGVMVRCVGVCECVCYVGICICGFCIVWPHVCVQAGSGSSYILRQSLSLEPECANLASLASQLDLDVPSPSLPSDGWNHRPPRPSRPASTWVLGIQTLILGLAQQALKLASQPDVMFLHGSKIPLGARFTFCASLHPLFTRPPANSCSHLFSLYSKAHPRLPLQQALQLPLCLPSSTISLSLKQRSWAINYVPENTAIQHE